MYYRRDKYGELIIDKGFMLRTDKDGNGIPFFSPYSDNGKKLEELWRKLNQNNKK